MIIVAGSMDFEPGVREQFLEMRAPRLLDNRKEPGCLEYVIGIDPAHPTRLFMYQLWADQESLDAHMGRVREMHSQPRPEPANPGLAPIDISVNNYEVGNVTEARR